MSPNMTSRKLLPIFTSYFWPGIMALVMAVFLSQWAIADPPEETTSTNTAETEMAAPSSDNDTIENTEPDNTQLEATPVVNKKPSSAISEKCYEQTDGSFECVCEGEKECEVMATADYCEAGTHWGKDGYGGCTKKAEK